MSINPLRCFVLTLVVILLHTKAAACFVSGPSSQQFPKAKLKILLAASDDNNNNNDDWQIALRQRKLSLQQRQEETQKRWRKADYQHFLVGAPDWVRRVSVQWPLLACGTARGDVYIIHGESGDILGCGKSQEDQRRYSDVPLDPKLYLTLKQLFGAFDGGGTLAIGLSWNLVVAHAGRAGGVELWKMNMDASISTKQDAHTELLSLGTLLEDVMVTSLYWAQDELWIGTQDGRVLVYSFDDDEIPSEPAQEWTDLGGTILSLSFNEELDVAVATTSRSVVELLHFEDNRRLTFYPPFDSGRMLPFALSTTIVEHAMKESGERKFSLVCGGNDGSIFLQPLGLLPGQIDPELDFESPFSGDVQELTTCHRGSCKCMASPFPGIFLSGGQDGTVRIWDLNNSEDSSSSSSSSKPSALYLLSGFKVWLGSLWTDGERLIMDGADNAISILNFGERDE